MALVRSILLVDGENLVMRYQAMLKKTGRKPKANVLHKVDTYVWTSDFGQTKIIRTDLVRINYYTSMVGDDDAVSAVKEELSKIIYTGIGDFYGSCQLYPRVFKKLKQSTKSRLVDINIVIDAMRHAYSDDVDVVYVFSGDGDFVNLVEDIARSGKRVCVAAFSSGLERRLVTSVDRFVLLDDFFFESAEIAGEAVPAVTN